MSPIAISALCQFTNLIIVDEHIVCCNRKLSYGQTSSLKPLKIEVKRKIINSNRQDLSPNLCSLDDCIVKLLEESFTLMSLNE